MNAKAERLNRGAALAFDPLRETIISDDAERLIRNYRLATAHRYEQHNPPRQRHVTYRTVTYPKCHGPDEGSGSAYSLGPVGPAPDLCVLRTYEKPPRNAVVARTHFRRLTVDGVGTNQFRTTVTRPDGRKVTLFHYTARDDWKGVGAAVLARALGLPKRAATDQAPAGKSLADEWIAASRDRMTAANDELVQSLAASGQLPPGSSFSASHVDPRTIAEHTDLLVKQLERGLTSNRGEIVATPEIARSLALLPDAAWKREAPGILAMLSRVGPVDADWHGDLLMRLADQGPSAIPVLARATGTRDLPEAVVIATCRIGKASAPALGSRMLEDWRRANLPVTRSYSGRGAGAYQQYRQCVERGEREGGPPVDGSLWPCWRRAQIWGHSDRVYIALKRMGLGTKADGMARHVEAARYARDYASIGPASPERVCMDSLDG